MNPLAIVAIILVAAMPVPGQTITGVSPTSAAHGTAHVLVTFTLGSNPPPPPIASVPTSVMIGTSTGSALARTGRYTVTGANGSNTLTRSSYVTVSRKPTPGSYRIVDTSQTRCFNQINLISAPTTGQPFYGQDAQVSGIQPSYTKSRDGLTVKDNVTGLTWQKSPDTNGDGVIDSLDKMTLAQTQTHITALNAANYGGYNDWRLPNAKELQSIVDYSRSPDTTSSAAIDPLFTCTGITNEAGKADFPFYWTSTTHMSQGGGPDPSAIGGGYAVYIAFGRAMGYMTGGNPRIAGWLDVHGAGAQRSDPKIGNPAYYPRGHGPQGDAIRIYNYVRLVRNAGTAPVSRGSAS